MKLSITLALCCMLFAACATSQRTSPQVPATAETVARRMEQLNIQLARIEKKTARLHSSSDLQSIRTARTKWKDYVRAEKKLRDDYAASGFTLGDDYYRSQIDLIEAFSKQWQQIEEMLDKPQ